MKHLVIFILAASLFPASSHADLTIVQDVEGAGPVSVMTIKIKGDKARIEPNSQVTTIIDSKTGDMLNLMNDQKKFMRVSAAQAKAAATMALQADPKKQTNEKPPLKPTGRKETINGYEAEEFVCKTPAFTATYWISSKYPNAPEILRQLQTMTPDSWDLTGQGMPDYRDFPGLPLRSVISVEGASITSSLKSVKLDPIPDSEFVPPKDFEEMKMPDINAMLGGKPDAARTAPSPKP